ncbi:hypothetical protein J6TS2_50450 [Heyndrickxia sporothermodurans]|nr:hypothetical protein J6TS2_50450 [Heyndrickxia sporothermodurans]
MEKLRQEIGKKIKQLRNDKGLSLRKLGAAIDYDPSHLNRIENGSEPSIKLLEKLAEYFEVDISYFFGEQTEIPTELKNAGTEWITFIDEMNEKELTPHQIKTVLEIFDKYNKK